VPKGSQAPIPKGGLPRVSADDPPTATIQKEEPKLPAWAAGMPEPSAEVAAAGEALGGGGGGSMLGGSLAPPEESPFEGASPLPEEPLMEGVDVAPVPFYKDPEFYKDPRVLGGAAAVFGLLALMKSRKAPAAPQPTVIVTK
jgi:hypothetical protein